MFQKLKLKLKFKNNKYVPKKKQKKNDVAWLISTEVDKENELLLSFRFGEKSSNKIVLLVQTLAVYIILQCVM